MMMVSFFFLLKQQQRFRTTKLLSLPLIFLILLTVIPSIQSDNPNNKHNNPENNNHGDTNTNTNQQQNQVSTTTIHVGVIGLGGMGMSIIDCLYKKLSSSTTSSTSTKEKEEEDNHHNNNNSTQPLLSYKIHGWNRGEQKRLNLIKKYNNNNTNNSDHNVPNVQVHSTFQQLLDHCTIILTMIDDWEGTIQMIYEYYDNHHNTATTTTQQLINQQKTIILFSTYSPHDIQKFQIELYHRIHQKMNTNHNNMNPRLVVVTPFLLPILVGGAIVGVPQTICTPMAYILSSTSYEKNKNNNSESSLLYPSILDVLGTHMNLTPTKITTTITSSSSNINSNSSIPEDNKNGISSPLDGITSSSNTSSSFSNRLSFVGYASLANIGLIQSITFGIVGHEVTQLMFQQYSFCTTEFIHKYNDEMVTQIVPSFIKMLLPLVPKTHITYVPARTFLNVLKVHDQFFMELQIQNDIYLAGYMKYLEYVVINEDKEKEKMKNHIAKDSNNHEKKQQQQQQQRAGPASWIQYAIVTSDDGSTSTSSDDTTVSSDATTTTTTTSTTGSTLQNEIIDEL